MNDTTRRREIAQLLSKAHHNARELTDIEGRELLTYFIRMSLMEVLAQQADVFDKLEQIDDDRDIQFSTVMRH